MRIDLHLGVHKTATTHLQRYWVACNPLGQAARIHCPPLDEVRAELTPLGGVGDGHGVPQFKRAQAYLGRLASAHARVILSDENLIGTCEGNFAQGCLYPNLADRMANLKGALQPFEVHLLISVRRYSDYLRSAYCEAIRHSRYFTFESAIKRFQPEKRRWPAILRELRLAFPQSTLTCWPYEALHQVRGSMTSSLFELDINRLPVASEERPRRTMSRLAIKLLDDIHSHAGAEVATAARASVEKLVAGPKMVQFDPWTDEVRARLDALYEEDLLVLRSDPTLRFRHG